MGDLRSEIRLAVPSGIIAMVVELTRQADDMERHSLVCLDRSNETVNTVYSIA